ncbi:DeoR/GlpR family DNA-binding transcription regulator [Terribacillus aidingensis]|uniref:DeoR/GlpR family DNA-binding transcription regulator n=1 Tax=Terribacillus aidingensis TaxID=586416 RepID=UPI00344B9037
MLVAERQRKIVELVNERASVRVTELSSLFHVTEETIRRDLEKLEREQLLHRSHGGAVRIEEGATEIAHEAREVMRMQEKQAIAKAAVSEIQTGERIILDASTTAWYMAKELPNMPLTIITNSIKVALACSLKDQIRVISLGGQLLSKSLSFVGPLTERSLTTYYVDKTFLSCKSVHLEHGLSDSNEQQAIVKKKMIEIAGKTILLADSSKFGKRAFATITELGRISKVYTDAGIDSATKSYFEKQNMEFQAVN